jgi:phosphoenolpyruvate carboxylase
MRRIPPTIASQHPDNALPPYWDKDKQAFIGAYSEMAEAVSCFQELGVSEYMWDWEGKHADAAVIDRLFSEYYDYFSKVQLGRDKFLTFRIPNIWEEKGYNLLQAMTVFLSGEDFARDLKFQQRPLFEMILPMTERADQLEHMQELFQKLARFKSEQFTADQPANNDYLEMIPLVESVESQLAVADLLTEYVAMHQKHFKRKLEYIRVFFACSDSSLTSGLLAGILANKLLVIRLYEFQKRTGIKVFPFAGPGSLRFRGGLSPYTIDRFLQEYAGVRTVTVQSAFRYDNPIEDVKAAIAKLEAELPKTPIPTLSADKQARLVAIGEQSAKLYRKTIKQIAGDMQVYFKSVPKRRDRRQHIGLVAYARSMGEQTLPRAITFTAAFYSIGVPPEFIAFGRSLAQLSPADLELLKTVYPNIANDLKAAGCYFNADNLAALAKTNPAWQQIQEDIDGVQAVLGINLGPQTDDQKAHRKLTAAALALKDDPSMLSEVITKAAILRRSLG